MTPRRTVRVVATLLALALSLTAGATTAPAGAGHGHGHRGHQGKVVWDSTTFYPGGAVAAHGRVPGGKKLVKLQVKLPGGWRTFAKTRSSRKGKFAIGGTLDWYGRHKVRVSTTGRQAFNRSTKVTVLTPYVPRGNPADRAFTVGAQRPDKGLRYSFNPCKTVKYVVNADDVGPGGIYLAQLGMAQLSWATGIKVKYVGTSHQIPFQADETRLPAGQDLLIAWADEAELPAFVTTPAVGFGGPVTVKRARDGAGRRILMSTQSAVALDTNAYLSGIYTQGYFGPNPPWGKVILHEIGHAFGLAHVTPADEMMHPGSVLPYPDGSYAALYGAGDLAGLATNGLGQGCFRKDNRSREEAPARIRAPQPLP